MPTLPWLRISPPTHTTEHLAMLTYLPLKHYRDSLRFLYYIVRIFLQLRKTDGLIGFSMRADPLTKQYWTLSLWENSDAMRLYVHTPPHFDIMKKMKGSMGQTAFSSWSVVEPLTELDWEEALSHQTEK